MRMRLSKILKQHYNKVHIRYLKLGWYGRWVQQSGNELGKLPLAPPAARRCREGWQMPEVTTRRHFRAETMGSGHILGKKYSPCRAHSHTWQEVSHCREAMPGCRALFHADSCLFHQPSPRACCAARCINAVTEHRGWIHFFGVMFPGQGGDVLAHRSCYCCPVFCRERKHQCCPAEQWITYSFCESRQCIRNYTKYSCLNSLFA